MLARGVWRIPPSFDGHQRSPLPRFTVLDDRELEAIRVFFLNWAKALLPVLVPVGASCVMVASNPLLSYRVSWAAFGSGFGAGRGEIVRLVMTICAGIWPKNYA